jgi:hypothetical protein
MNDTPKFVLKKQFEIIYKKPLKDKIAGIFEMTELSRRIILNQLKIKHPELSEVDLRVELFKTFYKFDFNKEILDKIAAQMREFLLNDSGEK